MWKRRSTPGTTRSLTDHHATQRYRRAGAAGIVVGALLMALTVVALPWLKSLALLSPAATGGSVLAARLFLVALGAFVVIEMPLLLVVLIRMAWRNFPPRQLNAIHFLYTLSPTFYGIIGALLTGVAWWAPLMWALGLVRILSSHFAIDPSRLAQKRRESTQRPAPRAAPDLATIRAFVLDMDGVLYRGNHVRDGAVDFVRYLAQREIPFVFLTNNATRSSAMYGEKLAALGIEVPPSRIIGAAQASAEALARSAVKGARVLPIGTDALRQALAAQHFTLVDGPPADYVVVGLDPELSYEKLKRAALAIRGGAQFIGTNPDKTFPAEEGLVPGNGSALAYLEAATDQPPRIMGKPSLPMMQVALSHLDVPASEVAMVGDRIETDIVGGQAAEMVTVLLLGGVSSPTAAEQASPPPDFIFDDLGDLLRHYRAARHDP